MIWTLSCPFEPVQVKNDIIIKCKGRLIYFNIFLLIIDRNKFMYHNNNEISSSSIEVLVISIKSVHM